METTDQTLARAPQLPLEEDAQQYAERAHEHREKYRREDGGGDALGQPHAELDALKDVILLHEGAHLVGRAPARAGSREARSIFPYPSTTSWHARGRG